MSRKPNRRRVAGGFERKRGCGFNDDVAGDFFDRKRRQHDDVAGDFFERKHRRHDGDVEDQLDDIIKLLKKILDELDEIEEEIEDEENGRHHKHCRCHGNGGNNTGGEGEGNKKGKRHCKCDDTGGDEEDCECDAVLISFRANPNPDERFGEILSVDSSGGSFGCNLRPRIGGTEGASVAAAIACLKCKGFKVQSVEETNGPNQTVLLTRKRCDD